MWNNPWDGATIFRIRIFFSEQIEREENFEKNFLIDSSTRWRKKLARSLSEGHSIHYFELWFFFGSILFGGNYFLVVILFSLPGFFWFQPVSVFAAVLFVLLLVRYLVHCLGSWVIVLEEDEGLVPLARFCPPLQILTSTSTTTATATTTTLIQNEEMRGRWRPQL